MRRTALCGIAGFLVCIVFAVFPSDSHAQRAIGVDVGAAIPFGKLGDVSDTGLSVGANAFYSVIGSAPNLRIGGRVAYNSFSENNLPNASSSASTVEIVPSFRYLIERKNRPEGYFAQAGLGIFISSFHYENIPGAEDNTDVDFGLSLAVGATYQVSDSFALVAMPVVNLSDSRYLSLNVGAIFGKRRAETARNTTF